MATKKPNQFDALTAIFKSGRRFTMDQLIELVAKKTGRSVTAGSISVQLSHLRAEVEIETLRGSNSTAKDGSTQYRQVK